MIIGGYDETQISIKGTKRSQNDNPNDMTKSDDGIFWMYIKSNAFWMVDLYEATVDGQ